MRIMSPLLLVVHRPLMAEISSIVAEVQPDLPFHQEENLQGIKNTLLGVPRAVVFFRWPRTSSDQHAWRELAREFFRSAFFVGLCRAPRIPALKDWPGNVLLIRSSRELKHLLQFSRWGASLGEPWAFRSQPGVTDEAPESPAVPLYLQWGYFLADAQGYLVKLSPGFRKWLETSAASSADQRPLWQLLGWPQSQWSQVCHAVLENGELFSWVGDWHPEAGNRFQIRLYLEPWQAKDGPSRLLCGALLNETALLEVQKALLESEQRYRALVELSPDAVGVHCRGRIVYINATGARLLGATSPQELIGQPILRFIHPDCLETVKQRLRTLMEERHGAPLVEQKFVRLDGRVIDVEVAAMPMEWKGEPAVQLVVREVGQRKQVENQLRNLAEQRKRLLDMSYALLGTLELKQIPQFVIEYLQSLVPFHRLGVFLWDESKSTLKPYYTFISPDSSYPKPPPVVPRQSLLGRAAQSGQALLVNQAHTNPKSYYPHGEHFPIEHLMGLPLKAGKEVLGVIGLQREKDPPFTREEFETAQIFANLLSQGLSNSRLFAEIRRSEKKYRALFEESGEGIFISTPEGEIIDINPAGLEILGFRSREELKNANIAAYYLDPVQRLELLRRLEKKGTVRNMELKLRRPDGKLVIVEETATVVRDERGRIVALRGIFRDVTEQKQLAEQLRQA
ncbi:MAG: PAS domain S-box protein, partial [Calditrichaeota bacterium]